VLLAYYSIAVLFVVDKNNCVCYVCWFSLRIVWVFGQDISVLISSACGRALVSQLVTPDGGGVVVVTCEARHTTIALVLRCRPVPVAA